MKPNVLHETQKGNLLLIGKRKCEQRTAPFAFELAFRHSPFALPARQLTCSKIICSLTSFGAPDLPTHPCHLPVPNRPL